MDKVCLSVEFINSSCYTYKSTDEYLLHSSSVELSILTHNNFLFLEPSVLSINFWVYNADKTYSYRSCSLNKICITPRTYLLKYQVERPIYNVLFNFFSATLVVNGIGQWQHRRRTSKILIEAVQNPKLFMYSS